MSEIPRGPGVYGIRCLETDKLYVGKTTNLRKRWSQHRTHLRSGGHANPHLQNAWNLYGSEAFEFEVLHECSSPEEAHLLEVQLVHSRGLLDPRLGFNLKDPASEGRGLPDPPVPEGVEIPPLSEQEPAEKRVPDPSVSESTRQKMSQVRKGVPKSIKTKARMQAAHLTKRSERGFSEAHVKAVRRAYLNVLYHRPGGISLLSRHLNLSYGRVYKIVKGLRWFPWERDSGTPPQTPPGPGVLYVITGPMFSSKSSELVRKVQALIRSGFSVATFKPVLDDRYALDAVVSHDGRKLSCTRVGSSAQFLSLAQEAGVQVVAFDEAQFMDDEFGAVCVSLVRRGIGVLVSGLDQDYQGRAFGPIGPLLCLAHSVEKRQAICSTCGGFATRTQRITNNQQQVVVGSVGVYEARCFAHWSPESVFSRQENQMEMDG